METEESKVLRDTSKVSCKQNTTWLGLVSRDPSDSTTGNDASQTALKSSLGSTECLADWLAD